MTFLLMSACIPGLSGGGYDLVVCDVRYPDDDGDGFAAMVGTGSCDTADGETVPGDDCDDGDGAIFPGAVESCDDVGVDNDCDSSTEVLDTTTTWYADVDQDGYGDPAVTTTTEGCDAQQPTGTVENAEDCDDADAEVNPEGKEICSNADDEDCSGVAESCMLDGSLDNLSASRGWQHPGTAVAVFGDGRVAVGDPVAHEVVILNGETGEDVARIAGEESTEFGASVAVGEFDGEEGLDVAVGAPGADGGAGEVTLWMGSDFGSSATISPVEDVVVFGKAISNLSNDSGDGLAIEFGSEDFSHKVSYLVYVISDPATAAVDGTAALPYAGAFNIDADATWPLTLSAAADGSALAVGYSGSSSGLTGAQVYPIPLPDTVSADVTFTSADAGLLLGASVDLVDLDGGGSLDLLVGAPGDGKVFGLLDGKSILYPDSAPDLTWTGDDTLSFGSALGLTGDLDGDGDTEFAIGGEGTLWIFFRDSDGGFALTAEGASATVTGFTGMVRSVLNAGDVDADGYDDLLIADDANVTLLFGGP